jgi:hypothetical protein
VPVGHCAKKKSAHFLLAQEEEIAQLMARFSAQEPTGAAVQQLEVLVRTAVFKSANALVGFLLQQAADRLDATYQPQPGEQWKGRETLQRQGMFGAFELERDYYYPPGKKQGHYPADAALGLEVADTPALARLLCLEGADELGYEKAQQHLAETGGIDVSARPIQRVGQRGGWSGPSVARAPSPARRFVGAPPVCQRRCHRRANAQRGIGGASRQTSRRQCQNPHGVSGVRLHPAPAR